jgi:cyclase
MKSLNLILLNLKQATLLGFVFLFSISHAVAQPVPGEPAPTGELELIHVQGQVWLIAGVGGNIAVQIGDQGIVVVDTGAEGFGQEVVDAIASLSDRPIRYIINTSIAAQHIGGNAVLGPRPGGRPRGAERGARVTVLAQETVLFGMSVARGPNGEQLYPQDAWPTDGYYEAQRGLIFNGEAIDIIHMPYAHTEGDSIVYFRGSNVLVSGDIYTTTNLPMVDYTRGGTFQGLIDALDRMLDITIADDLMEGGTYVIPGHGYISDEADLVEYRDMTYIVRDRLQRLIVEEGQDLQSVKQARPVLGWEGRYGRPEWSVDMFLEAVYQEFADQ